VTDDDKTLVKRLRDFVGRYDCPDGVVDDAADRICELITDIEAQAAENERLREALNYAWDLIEEASYSDSVMGVKQDRFLSTYYDENGLRAALGETE